MHHTILLIGSHLASWVSTKFTSKSGGVWIPWKWEQ